MPYMIKKQDGKFAVFKKDASGSPMGDAMGTHPTREDAQKQMDALYAKEPGIAQKDMDVPFMMRLEPDDPRAMYNPMGATGDQGCATCQWFCAHEASCALIWDDVVATGKCNLWLAKPTKADIAQQAPLPVVIVEPPVDTGSEEAKPAPVETAKKESPIIAWLKQTFGKKTEEPLTGAGFKSLDDTHWVAYYTNSFEDKAGQIFSEKSSDQYIAWLDKGLIPPPELWYWHIPGTKHGTAQWVDRVDHVNIAVGTYDQTPMAQFFRKEYGDKPHKLSHTYGYPKQALQDGVYHSYFTIEISPLPAGKEANPYTTFTEVKEMAITDEKKQALVAILGKELADQVIGDGARMSADLEALGIKFKEAEGLPAVDTDARDALKTVATASKAATDTLTQQIEQLATGVKALTDGVAARDKQIADLTAANAQLVTTVNDLAASYKEMMGLAPRASRAPQTVITTDDPLAGQAAFLAQKQGAAGAQQPKSVGEQIAAMVFPTTPPQA